MRPKAKPQALLTVQKAQADAIRMINEANPNHNFLALRSMEAMEKVADGKATKLIVPSDMQNLAATVAAIQRGCSGQITGARPLFLKEKAPNELLTNEGTRQNASLPSL